jgi:glycosyltransferase involved in cell wall biosynthesis
MPQTRRAVGHAGIAVSVEVSVVIPTFRRNRELAETIASVQAQAAIDIEIVIVDDSPEGVAQTLVETLGDPRISYMRNPSPTGGVPSIVRNLGWPRTSGKFIHFLDDDDIVPAGYYAAAMAGFASSPEAGLVFGRIEPFGACPEAQFRHEQRYFAQAARNSVICARLGRRLGFAAQMLFDLPILVCSASMVRRECVASVGGFDPNIRLMEDADFHLRIMRSYGACFLDRLALNYRIGYPSLMHAPIPSSEQRQLQREGRLQMRAKYRRQHGAAEYYALALLNRIVRLTRS